ASAWQPLGAVRLHRVPPLWLPFSCSPYFLLMCALRRSLKLLLIGSLSVDLFQLLCGPILQPTNRLPENWEINVRIDGIGRSWSSLRMAHQLHSHVFNHSGAHESCVECVPELLELNWPDAGVSDGCPP